jgi:hypothetical protein
MQVPFYYDQANAAWSGLWTGILYTVVLLVVIDYTESSYTVHDEKEAYKAKMTWVSHAKFMPACPHTS